MQLFNDIDVDKSGYITADEVVALYKKVGSPLTLDEAKQIVAKSDTDKDGKISYDGNYYFYAIYNSLISAQSLQSHCMRDPYFNCSFKVG